MRARVERFVSSAQTMEAAVYGPQPLVEGTDCVHARAMHVRRARPPDAPSVETLYRLLVPGDDHVSVQPERLAALENDATNQLLVLELEGAVTGTVFVSICLDAMYGFQPYAVLENLIVLPGVRGRGAGAALVREVERIARAARCTKLMLLSSRSREPAHAFFARLGFDGDRKRAFVKYLNRSS